MKEWKQIDWRIFIIFIFKGTVKRKLVRISLIILSYLININILDKLNFICRVNEQMDLTITHTLWMREHNRYGSGQPIVPGFLFFENISILPLAAKKYPNIRLHSDYQIIHEFIKKIVSSFVYQHLTPFFLHKINDIC